MIYLRLHQARYEEVDPGGSKSKQEQEGASRSNWGNFAIIAKFRYNSKILAIIAKFRYNGKIFTMYSDFAT